MDRRLSVDAKDRALPPILTSRRATEENELDTTKKTTASNPPESISPSSPVAPALARPPRSKDRIPSPLPRSYTLDRLHDANTPAELPLPRSGSTGDMATVAMSSLVTPFSTNHRDIPLPTKFEPLQKGNNSAGSSAMLAATRRDVENPDGASIKALEERLVWGSGDTESRTLYTPPLSFGMRGDQSKGGSIVSQPSHSFSFDTDIFNNYLEESPSFFSHDPAHIEPPPISSNQSMESISTSSQYSLGFDHLPPISVSPASPPRRALPAAPISRTTSITSIASHDQPALPTSPSGSRSFEGAKEVKVNLGSRGSLDKLTESATAEEDAWSGILDETPRAEDDSGREFFRERFASNGYKYDRPEDPIVGTSSPRTRSSPSSSKRGSADNYRAPQAVPLPPSPSVSRSSSARTRSRSVSTASSPLPSTSSINPSTSKASLTSHRSFSPIRSSDYGATRRSSTSYLADTREESTVPRRRSEAPTASKRFSDRSDKGRMDDVDLYATSRSTRQRASTESIGKGSALSAAFDQAPSPTRMRRSPTITQSSMFDSSKQSESPRSDGSPRFAPPTQTIFDRRDQPSLSTRTLQPIRTAAPPSSFSPLSQNGAPAPDWLSRPPASRRTSDISPPPISPTSAATVRRTSLNNLVEYESTPRSRTSALPSTSSRSSSRSSTRGAREGSADGYYSARPTDSPPIDTATATILHNSPATLAFRSSIPRSDSASLQQQNLASPTREAPPSIRTKGQRRVSDKKPPPLRAKSVRRTSAIIRKMASSEDLSSGNQYASADDSSLGGGGFSDLDGTDTSRKLPGQLSASDFVDAYGAFDNSSAPPSDNELGRMSASSSRYNLESNSFASPSPPKLNGSRSGKFIDVPVQTRSHSRTSSNEMIDELDVQIEEAMANFAFHGITPTSPTGPPPLLSPYQTEFGPPNRRVSGEKMLEDDRRPSLGMSSQSEDEVYHEAESTREFSPDYEGYRASSHSRPISSSRGEDGRRASIGRHGFGSTTTYDAREDYEKSIRLLSPETVYDGDEGSPSMGGPDASEDDEFVTVEPPRRPSRQSSSGSVVQPFPSYQLATATTNTRGDAKARAAAFVADLRRARGVGASEDSTRSTVIPVQSGSTNRESTSTKRESDDYSNRSSRRGSEGLQPRSDSALTSVQLARRRSSERSRAQDGTASTISLASTLSAPGGVFNGGAMSTPSLPATIPPQIGSIGAMQSVLPTTPIPSPAPSPRPDRHVGFAPLRRSRLLPTCATYGDILQQKTAGERAKSYAFKIKGLSQEESGLNVWISVITGAYTYSPSIASHRSDQPSPSLQVPTQGNHPPRNDPSATSAISFPVRQDAYRAKEITRTSFSPDDLIPSVPYPGVLATHRFTNPRDSSSSSTRSRERTVPTIGTLAKTTFLSLGRKTSRRTGHSSAPATVSGARGMITGPMGINLGIVGPPSFVSRASSGSVTTDNGTRASSIRSISGPRMPGNSRSSIDGFGPPTSPSSGSLAYQARPITPQTAREREIEAEKLASMSDILTQANRADLLDCLRRNGGEVSAAISEWITLFDRE